MAEDNVKVAVRVRPFNGREKERNAQCIIKMDGATTSITNPENGDIKNFAFDYSYWSHAPSSNFATQKTVFDDLGIGVLENAWKGYNVSLFAYGQTGAGKSYSMVGYGEDKGIIPCACAELFRRIENNTAPEVTFRVQASMMEIYNERVRDLFNPSNKANEGGGLKVRDNPKTGPYVDGLALLPVKDYSQVDTLMDEGTKARTVASTQMNATSSRAHTIFTLILTQTKVDKAAGKAMDKVSKISLVDLAGSERASGTGATGERLKEGAAINKSLSALGNVISSLAEAAGGGGKKAFVPYRDSVLTWLLKESLGGNAKTIMIAALSPADINYEETLSTLRYADRAKQIKNAAIVNEDPNQKMIRELKEEVERLRLLAAQQSAPAVDLESLTAAARREAEEEAARKFAEYEEELAESKKLLAELNKSWEEKERDAQSIQQQRHLAMVEMGLALSEEDMQLPQLININQDPTRSGAIIYALKQGDTTVGRPDAPTPQTIKLVGLNMSKHHAVITNAHGSLSITSVAGGRTWVNGELLTDLEERQAAAGGGDQGVQLSHNDRLRFGNNHLFRVFDHEAEERRIASRADKEASGEEVVAEPVIDWEFAQLELAAAAGATSLLMSEEELKAAEAFKQKMEETERQLIKEKQDAADKAARLQKDLEERDAQLQKMVGESKVQAEKALEEERAAFMAEQKKWEEEVARRTREAEALRAVQARQKRDKDELQDQIVTMMPLIQEANMVSDELSKGCYLELKVLNQDALEGQRRMKRRSLVSDGVVAQSTTIAVRVLDRHRNTSRLWSRDKFFDRIFAIRDYYQCAMRCLGGDAEAEAELRAIDEQGNDPFFDDVQGVIIGHVHVLLESLWWLFPIEISSPVIDYKGLSEGKLKLDIRILGEDHQELVLPDGSPGENIEQFFGQTALLVIEILEATGLPAHMTDFYVQFHDLLEGDHRTPTAAGSSANRRFNYKTEFKLEVNRDLQDKLLSETLAFQVWGRDSRSNTDLQRPMTVAGRLSEKERILREREQELAAREAAFEQELLRPMTGAAHLARTADVFSLDEDEGENACPNANVDRLDMYDDEEKEFHSKRHSVVRFSDAEESGEEQALMAEMQRLHQENEDLRRIGSADIDAALAKEKAEKDALAMQLEQIKEQQRKQLEEMEAKLKEHEKVKPVVSCSSRACCLM